MYTNVYSFDQTIVSHSFVSFKVCCMLYNSHCLNTTFKKMFMYTPRFQFGHGNLV